MYGVFTCISYFQVQQKFSSLLPLKCCIQFHLIKFRMFPLGVNFTCTISYNDYTGYSVSCVGSIPVTLMDHFEKITCRPRSSLIDEEDSKKLEAEFELPECDIATSRCLFVLDIYEFKRIV